MARVLTKEAIKIKKKTRRKIKRRVAKIRKGKKETVMQLSFIKVAGKNSLQWNALINDKLAHSPDKRALKGFLEDHGYKVKKPKMIGVKATMRKKAKKEFG